MPARKLQRGHTEYGIEDEPGNTLVWPSAMTKGAARVVAKELAGTRGESVYVFEVGEDRDGTRIVVDREEIRPPGRQPKSNAQVRREVDEILARPPGSTPRRALSVSPQTSSRRAPAGRRAHATRGMTSERILAQMIGRHVKSGWSGLVDGEILQWEPFGGGGTDVLVRDVTTGKETWHASHGLTPIDGRGPLPSRAEVRKIRDEEMAASMQKIAERWASEPPRPRIRR